MSDGLKQAAKEGEVTIAEAGKNHILKSEGFYHCSLFVLRDRKTGESLLAHLEPDSTDGTRRGLAAGVFENELEKIYQFVATHEEVVGVSLHGHSDPCLGDGGSDDLGATQELRELGVKMFRHNVPAIMHDAEIADMGKPFDAAYDVDADTLHITRTQVYDKSQSPETLLLLRNMSERSFVQGLTQEATVEKGLTI